MHLWKGLANTFPTVYYTPQIFNITITKQKRKFCSCLTTSSRGGQKFPTSVWMVHFGEYLSRSFHRC